MRKQIYLARSGKLIYEAFGTEAIMHSRQAAEQHAAESGAEAVIVGMGNTDQERQASIDAIPQQTVQEKEWADKGNPSSSTVAIDPFSGAPGVAAKPAATGATVAHESLAHYLSVNAPDLMPQYVAVELLAASLPPNTSYADVVAKFRALPPPERNPDNRFSPN